MNLVREYPPTGEEMDGFMDEFMTERFKVGDVIYSMSSRWPDVYLITGIRHNITYIHEQERARSVYDVFEPYTELAYSLSQEILDRTSIICPTLPMHCVFINDINEKWFKYQLCEKLCEIVEK